MRLFTKIKGLAAVTCVAALASSAAFAQEMTLKLGHLANEQNAWHLAAVKFGEELSTLTDGRIAVEVFPNESLGKEIDLINGMQLGTVDMTITGESLQNWAPMAALLAVPYAYKSLEHMDEVASGEIGEQIKQQIIEKAQVRPIAFFARGPRNLTSQRPITSPADLDGMKMRVPNVPLFVDVWSALGASPTPMAFSEVFTSLQNGVIDGQENPLALIRSANFNEVQGYVNQTEHVRSWIYLTIAESTWAKLSEDDQNAVMQAAATAQEYERGLLLESLAEDRGYLESKGMTFVEVDGAAFQAAAKDAVLANVSEEIRPIVESLFSE
ncbi:C4-dicarboxylate ABC transporter [Roseobacter denitrificans]|uniref:Solute-binding protein RD1_1052 n=1 Tax=Roseobacter denitrificans (strain ATCC 33942 / OCh 114) TaxID=375451 RepID=DCTP_ROSDO|nr:TRAP transporter substrate-binding protein [Roseobacter denitrificans]Q16BC9.1 RecName: Full=Solute-binding protein RD1_1052; Flags: Precursor [Roseobacter denitrificans OCh 114]ABG30714.1 C4-dicarboxylate transport system, substrate-binding protein, putative [Roseobacter denitrificans OCh 114]AVL53835.1 C4-dicarboxylate ABC transporter [Roseobacter denitrificans]SFG18009.1 tripartite ATP-independent transporter solute receptor, DctP family [Roseobacter denitrificans OCh 114]